MKNNLTKICIVLAAIATVLYACKKNAKKPDQKAETLVAQKCLQEANGMATQNLTTIYPYNVYLAVIINNHDGTYTWEWRVRNLNPGNGTAGTVQDLIYWGISLGDCITMDNILSAVMSSNDGITWNSFTPKFEVDTSQNCFTDKILKFDLGTTGTNISRYRVTVNKAVSHTAVTAIYKSGNNTGCGIFETCGFGCPSKSNY